MLQMSTLVDILHSWAYEHYPVEILEQISFTIVSNNNGIPIEIILDRHPGIHFDTTSFDPADPAFFSKIETILFRMWGLKACKRPFRTFIEKTDDDKA